MLKFELHKGSANGPRAGLLLTRHGEVPTPSFMPVGTLGTVKGMAPWDLREVGARMILANTYHLVLRPGVSLIEKIGGLHKFMGWNGPILTDSGGYQVVSLGGAVKISEEGVAFSSHIDGARLELTPENVVRAQAALGVDIAMCLDQPIKLPADKAAVAAATDRTSRWAKRSIDEINKIRSNGIDRQGVLNPLPSEPPALFGIVQGGSDFELRAKSAREITSMGFDGYAIGGLSVGEDNEILHETNALTTPLLPERLPRYLMGVGTPVDLLRAIGAGVDLFDCVLPTRNARNGWIYTFNGPLRIKHAAYKDDFRAPQDECGCGTCANFSRAYLRHLYMCGEMLAGMLITRHNIYFYMQLMRIAREAIMDDRYEEFAKPLIESMRRDEIKENQEAGEA